MGESRDLSALYKDKGNTCKACGHKRHDGEVCRVGLAALRVNGERRVYECGCGWNQREKRWRGKKDEKKC
jgi:hypothetical protein